MADSNPGAWRTGYLTPRVATWYHLTESIFHKGLPRWCLKNLPTNARLKRRRFDPWVGKIPWWRKWQPSPVFLLGESHGQRSLVGPWGHKDSDMAEHLTAFSIRPRRPVKRPEERAEPQDQPEAGAQRLPCLSCVLRRVHSHMRTSRSPGIYQNLLKPLWTPPIPRFPFWGFFFFFFGLPFGH